MITTEALTKTDNSPEQSPTTIPDENLYRLADFEKHHILHILEMTRWTIAGKGGAAEILDLPASTLRSKMKKLGIHRPK